MKNNKSMKLTALLLALVLVTSCFVGGTFARYVTSTSSEDSARVAVWGINADEVTMDLFDAEYELDGTVVARSNDGDNIIAPGTGKMSKFSIVNLDDNLAPEVMYEIAINLDDSEIDQAILNNPSIQWKLDNNTWGTWESTKADILALSGDASGVKTYAPLEIATEFANGVEHTIAWQWMLDGNNVQDTAMGNEAVDRDITAKISVKVTAKQVNVDTTGMLEGNDQVYDINNPTPLVFRSAAPADELVEVKVGETTLIRNTDYTVSSGSTIITLTESGINKLGTGNFVISIISENMTANASFTVKETEISFSPIHNNIIPIGGTYYSVTYDPTDPDALYETIGNSNYISLKDCSSAIEYNAGDEFPEPKTGDIYFYGDYEYRYNMTRENTEWLWYYDGDFDGWSVATLEDGKTSYSPILTQINGKNVTKINSLFKDLDYILGYTNEPTCMLTTAPIIPETITNMNESFNGCIYLTGSIEINATSLHSYRKALRGTQITEITGTISENLKTNILLTRDE